ncbi:MAG TPA: PspC domain-containing protein [Acidimicrobiales bacterium]|nr:PspC domain-containing protein [Acidimicrobiales bacterium]
MTYTEEPQGAQQPPAGPGPGAREVRSLRRSTTNRMVAGVAGGLAEYLDADPVAVRIGFAIASLVLGGIGGPLLYAAAWLVVPETGQATSIAAQRLGGQPWA